MPATSSAVPALPSPIRRSVIREPEPAEVPIEPPDSWRRIREDLAMLRRSVSAPSAVVVPSRPTN